MHDWIGHRKASWMRQFFNWSILMAFSIIGRFFICKELHILIKGKEPTASPCYSLNAAFAFIRDPSINISKLLSVDLMKEKYLQIDMENLYSGWIARCKKHNTSDLMQNVLRKKLYLRLGLPKGLFLITLHASPQKLLTRSWNSTKFYKNVFSYTPISNVWAKSMLGTIQRAVMELI